MNFIEHTQDRIKTLKRINRKERTPNDKERNLVITQLQYLLDTYFDEFPDAKS